MVIQMNRKIISFLYHEVTDNPTTSGFLRVGAMPYKHRIEHFKHDLDLILRQFMNSEDVTKLNINESNPCLLLTFDDGGSSAVDIAEILKTRKLLGHFFITTSMIGCINFLNEEQIIGIRRMGHLIGSHSHTHPHVFRDLSYSDKIHEWRKSKQILEEILNEEISTASIPGGDMDLDTIRSAGEVGIKYLFTSEPNYTPYIKHGVHVFGRICPKNSTKSSDIIKWSMGKGFFKAKSIRYLKQLVRMHLKFIYRFYLRLNNSSL